MKKKYLLDEKIVAESNGEEYYLRLRSNNTDNPVVLFLHGGCGNPDRPFMIKYQSPLAEVCTIVAWDQRGSGVAYNAKKAETEVLTMDLYVEDTHNVILYLKKRFNQDKIYIVGHSFGSMLGVYAAKKYPADIAAYIGVGQLINAEENEKILYDWVLEQAKSRNDKKAVAKLEAVGKPVNAYYKDNKILTVRNYLWKYGGAQYGSNKTMIRKTIGWLPLFFSEYSLCDMVKYVKGINYCVKSPIGSHKLDFFTEITELEVPIYLLLGHHDYNCPFMLAEKWLSLLKAPYKELVWFEHSAHEPQWEEPKLWNETFAKKVLGKEI